ncbi:hypothetical protein I4522_022525 [Klebsiella pneumoniae]
MNSLLRAGYVQHQLLSVPEKGSNYLPYPKLYPYYGGMFYALSNEVEIYRNGNRDNPRDRVYTANSPVLVKMALTERIVKDIPTGSIGYAAIIPKEDDFLEFECRILLSWATVVDS